MCCLFKRILASLSQLTYCGCRIFNGNTGLQCHSIQRSTKQVLRYFMFVKVFDIIAQNLKR